MLAQGLAGAGASSTYQPRRAEESVLFADTTDPDYITMIEAIREGHRQMLARPRVDMRGPEP